VGIYEVLIKKLRDLTPKIEDINVHELLPQQPPFVMIDRLTHFDMTVISTALTIPADNIFVENDVFTEAGVIESIAQTCAARMGYINKYILKKSVKLGFIGAIKNLAIEKCPQTGDTIAITVEVKTEILSVILAFATVTCGDDLIASCEMKISLSDIDSQTEKAKTI
jgi:predicted hotdog family 3-hydroxylacyl-ACP dehydratase